MKKRFKWIGGISLFLVLVWVLVMICLRSFSVHRDPIPVGLQMDVPDVGYEERTPLPAFTNLRMIGQVTRNGVSDIDGVILRVLQFKPIAEAVEYRYSLPRGIVLAMLAQESHGGVLLNGADDGGAGLCHMQPSTAKAFGLTIYRKATKLIDKKHGRDLRLLVSSLNGSLAKLCVHDDRFHPVINLDAVGRMLCVAMEDSAPTSKKYSGNDQLQAAVFVYSGRPEYWNSVMRFREKLYDRAVIEKIRKRFNKLNQTFSIDGIPSDFDGYLHASWRVWENFDLSRYKALPLYAPKGIEKINSKYGAAPGPNTVL